MNELNPSFNNSHSYHLENNNEYRRKPTKNRRKSLMSCKEQSFATIRAKLFNLKLLMLNMNVKSVINMIIYKNCVAVLAIAMVFDQP